jgi:oxygen-dependent protoporphyrinogen oxidase
VTGPSRPIVAVVGAGIAGLAAAWELVTGSPGDRPLPEVHVFEATDRVGGKLRATEFAGRTVDLAADAFLARRPEATDLCAELGITDSLVPVGASGASIWARGRLRMMPAGLNLGVPTRWWPLARSGILSPAEAIRPALDLVTPRLRSSSAFGDRAVGAIVGERLGTTVVERLVDPLVGGINAGGVDELSAAATFPVLIAASHQAGSLMRSLARAAQRSAASAATTAGDGPTAPVFWSLPGSTASLAVLLADALVARGVAIHTGVAVEAVGQTGGQATGAPAWRLSLGRTGPAGDGPTTQDVDGLILAVPAPEAGVLLAPFAPEAAGMLSVIAYGSVAVVTMALPPGAIGVPLRGTGFLVPRTSTIDGRSALITGVTYLGRKWPHLARAGDDLIRASVGRFGDERHAALDDDQLIASVLGELTGLIDLRGTPLEATVTRWDAALPQHEVGHLIRVGRVERSLAGLGTVAVAGAALRGVGIPACIGSGRSAARQVLAGLSAGTGTPSRP